MAKGNKLYSAYRGAGKASASYKASLYDIENLGIEREASQSMYQFETAQRDKTLALVQQGIGLASDLYGGHMAKKEATADRATMQKGMAKKAYEGDVAWDKLTDTARASEIEKFAPKPSERGFVDKLFGVEKSYTFGEGGDEFTSSQITAASSLYGDDKLSELLGINKSSKIEALQENFTESVDKKVESKSKNIVGAAPELNVDLTGNLKIDKKPSDSKIPDFSDFEIPSLLGDDEDLLGHWAREPKGKSIKSFAKGGKFTTDGPEMILVGDNPSGKEKVSVKPIKSKKKEKSEGQESLADGLGSNLKQLVSKKGTKPGSNKWMSNYIQSQKINNESLRPLQGGLSKHNKKLFSMAEESGYFGEFFRGGWE